MARGSKHCFSGLANSGCWERMVPAAAVCRHRNPRRDHHHPQSYPHHPRGNLPRVPQRSRRASQQARRRGRVVGCGRRHPSAGPHRAAGRGWSDLLLRRAAGRWARGDLGPSVPPSGAASRDGRAMRTKVSACSALRPNRRPQLMCIMARGAAKARSAGRARTSRKSWRGRGDDIRRPRIPRGSAIRRLRRISSG